MPLRLRTADQAMSGKATLRKIVHTTPNAHKRTIDPSNSMMAPTSKRRVA
jgi:hypothetical protein